MFDTFVGTSTGVVRVGARIEPLGLSDHRISAIHAFRGRAGDVVLLAGSYGEGLFRSDDEGRTWSSVANGMTAPAARTILPDPLQPGAILCGTEPARIFRSRDEGASWSELDGISAIPAHAEWYLPYSPRAGAVRSVYSPPAGRATLLAAGEVAGLLRSDDGGATWSVSPIGPNDDVHQVTGDAGDPAELWSALGFAALRSRRRGEGAPRLGGVGRSRDGGATWRVLHTDYTRSVVLPPARPDLVLAGPAGGVGERGRIEVSGDRGESWRPAAGGVDVPMPDMVELFVPAPDGSVYAVCSGGRLLRADPEDLRWRSALPDGAPAHAVSVSLLPD